jgi:hypothetical protein
LVWSPGRILEMPSPETGGLLQMLCTITLGQAPYLADSISGFMWLKSQNALNILLNVEFETRIFLNFLLRIDSIKSLHSPAYANHDGPHQHITVNHQCALYLDMYHLKWPFCSNFLDNSM